ncbi:MAG: DUF3303 family protein [Acidimicrobiales bacterium]
MKFMITWTLRDREGASPAERIAEGKAILDAFKRYTPHPDTQFLQWVSRADQLGGCAIIETDNAVALNDAVGKFNAWYEWDIAPVFDLMDEQALQMFQENYDYHA